MIDRFIVSVAKLAIQISDPVLTGSGRRCELNRGWAVVEQRLSSGWATVERRVSSIKAPARGSADPQLPYSIQRSWLRRDDRFSL